MIIWLGSYPRSGIATLRFLMHSCFGLKSYSLQRNVLEDLPEAAAEAGFAERGKGAEEFIAEAEASPDLYLIKTFGAPNREERSIYLVRDGRAATYSYWKVMAQAGPRRWAELRGLARIPERCPSLEEVVVGRTPDGSWSQHVDDWTAPDLQPLVLRYETLAHPSTVEAIAGYLGRSPLPNWTARQAAGPRRNRYEGDDSGVAEITRQCPDLFDAAHGEMMRRLGYASIAAP